MKNNCEGGVCDMKNQTRSHLIPEDVNVEGIAFFVIKNEEGLEKIKVEDITYQETLNKGEDTIAFNFLPYGAEVTINGEKTIVKKGMFN